jgi:hypothetical protein
MISDKENNMFVRHEIDFLFFELAFVNIVRYNNVDYNSTRNALFVLNDVKTIRNASLILNDVYYLINVSIKSLISLSISFSSE